MNSEVKTFEPRNTKNPELKDPNHPNYIFDQIVPFI